MYKMYNTCVQGLATAFVSILCLMVGTAGAADCDKLPGTAEDVGEGWIISTESAGPHGNGIRRWNGLDWENMPGAAVRIGGTYLQPWVVNSNGNIYRWTGSDWEWMSGATADDVGEGWIISTESAGPHGNGIRRWNGSDWENMPGAAVAIGGTYLQPWVVNVNGNIYRWTGSDWEFVSGTTADDVGEGWAIGTGPGVAGGNTIWRWNGSGWETIGGAAVRIGGTALDAWVVNAAADIYRLQF